MDKIKCTGTGHISQCSPIWCRVHTAALWLALGTAWLVSIFSVVEEMCLASACRDTASFTFFGLGLGWFGIAYFAAALTVLWLRARDKRADLVLVTLVFCGIGAEFRLLWIQKYIIGSWCPLCVTICCALSVAAVLLVLEQIRRLSEPGGVSGFALWLARAAVMASAGLLTAITGVKALY